MEKSDFQFFLMVFLITVNGFLFCDLFGLFFVISFSLELTDGDSMQPLGTEMVFDSQ
jgi:hypothetical protein